MKSKTWFARLLSVYLPIFYMVIVFLGFMFFLTMSQMMNAQMTRSSETYSRHIMQTIEASLQMINQIVIREIDANEDVEKFLYIDSIPGTNEHLLHSRLSEKFRSLMVNFPYIDSIYYYRISDQKVLSSSALLPMEYFGDREFVERLEDGDVPYTWTGVRPYRLFANQHPYPVVSLVKKVPLFSTANGFIVVNVSTQALEEMVQGLSTQDISYTSVYDGDGRLIASSGVSGGDELSVVQSKYAGWEVRSGLRDTYRYAFISDFYYGFVVVGLIALALGTAFIVFFARKYTSPIDGMLNRILHYTKGKSQPVPGLMSSHPRFIEQMVDHLIETANQFNDVHKENMLYRKKHFFQEWVGGERAMNAAAWEREMAEIGLETSFRLRYVALLEIHQYAKMCEKYSYRDQYLFKYVIGSVMQEVGADAGASVWAEWLEAGRLTVLLQYRDEDGGADERTAAICDRVRLWIQDNMDYTVSIGIGRKTDIWSEVPLSMEEAEKALLEKPIEGNATIRYADVLRRERERPDYLQAVHRIVDGFKRRNESWEAELIDWMDDMFARIAVRQDIDHIVQYFLFQLANAFSGMPASYKDIWNESDARLKQAILRYDTAEELRDTLLREMRQASERIGRLRTAKNNQELLQRARGFIEEHASDPNLSLALLSERFQINQSYMSRLFKEEFGENFVDYVAKIRVLRSKELLESTDRSIQDIAQQVGYPYTFSFNRVFKKIVGVTPGEYRRQSLAGQG